MQRTVFLLYKAQSLLNARYACVVGVRKAPEKGDMGKMQKKRHRRFCFINTLTINALYSASEVRECVGQSSVTGHASHGKLKILSSKCLVFIHVTAYDL
jgi:hypothetical protein